MSRPAGEFCRETVKLMKDEQGHEMEESLICDERERDEERKRH